MMKGAPTGMDEAVVCWMADRNDVGEVRACYTVIPSCPDFEPHPILELWFCWWVPCSNHCYQQYYIELSWRCNWWLISRYNKPVSCISTMKLLPKLASWLLVFDNIITVLSIIFSGNLQRYKWEKDVPPKLHVASCAILIWIVTEINIQWIKYFIIWNDWYKGICM